MTFKDLAYRGPIQYLPGNLTHLDWPDASFDAVTCLSVIEHGVPLEAYFHEMYRVLRPGGYLITSTDYHPHPIDTRGMFEHGSAVKVFNRPDVLNMLAIAHEAGFEMTGPLNLNVDARPVRWAKFDLTCTFLIFTLRRPLMH